MKPLLLDTHTFLCFTEGNPRLSTIARGHIEDPANVKWISIASLWEIAIKVAIGKLSLTLSLPDLFMVGVSGNGLRVLSIEQTHILQTTKLPFHHRDPFDRLLVAQSLMDITKRQIHIYRSPAPDGYTDATTHGENAHVSLANRPDTTIQVSALLPSA